MISFQSRALKSTLKYSIRSLGKGKGKEISSILRDKDQEKQQGEGKGWKDSFKSFALESRLKFKQNQTSILICLAFYISGCVYYSLNEPFLTNHNDDGYSMKYAINILLIGATIRNSALKTDWSNFYQLCWPIFLEVVVFGFIGSSLLDAYNPVVVCRLNASSQTDHSVIIGCNHLGEKVIDFLKKHHRPFTVIFDNSNGTHEKVDNLIKSLFPVVLGNPSDLITLKAANVTQCNEIFVLLNDLQTAVLACFRIRALNKNCRLYVQIFEHEEFNHYFAQDPLNAYTFSTSSWAIGSVVQWIQEKNENPNSNNPFQKIFEHKGSVAKAEKSQKANPKEGAPEKTNSKMTDKESESDLQEIQGEKKDASKVLNEEKDKNKGNEKDKDKDKPKKNSLVIIGNSNLSKRIVSEVTKSTNRVIYTVDLSSSGSLSVHRYGENQYEPDKSKILSVPHQPILSLEYYVPLNEISHVFVCWNKSKHFSDIAFLLMMLKSKYQHVETYVQIADEALATIIADLGGIPFSTSSHAFSKLVSEMPPSSNLYIPVVALNPENPEKAHVD